MLAVFVALVLLYGVASERLQRTPVTAPIVFTAAGMLLLLAVPELRYRQGDLGVFLRVAEIGLVLLLFTDASRTDLQLLKQLRYLPVRLLSTGMLLTIALGTACARLLFPELSVWEAGILGAILAPTDAGLGQVIVNSPLVPVRVRQALNVEAGLNDGLSVPFLLFFMAMADSHGGGGGASLAGFIWAQLGLGTLIGLGVGLLGGALLGLALRRRWMAEEWQQLSLVTLPVACALACEAVGASMFIAAFVAGLAVQPGFPGAGRESCEFADGWGQLLNLSVFFLFGLLVARAWGEFDVRTAAYALVSLTVVRMLPVWIALLGTGLSGASVLFMGWFGPRGLASIVLGLVYLEEALHRAEPVIRLTVMATVALSIFLHGLTAAPGTRLFAGRVSRFAANAPERQSSQA